MVAFMATNENGRSRAVAIATEMTKELSKSKSEAEAALREVTAFRTVIDQHSIVSVADRQGRIIEANPEFCRISGYSQAELIGKNHSLINSGHHSKEFWIDVWSTISSGKTWQGEVCNRTKNGMLYWVESIICPFLDVEGKVEKYVSIRHDITERKVAQQKIINSEVRFRSIADGAPLLIWTSRQDGKADYFNDPWLRFTGRTFLAEAFDGWHESIHSDDQAIFLESYKAAFRDRRAFEIECRMRRHDGEYRVMIFRGNPQIGANESFLGFVGVSIDLTDLRDAQHRAEAASRSKSAFLANMSHEIRTPLTAILGYADLLKEENHTMPPEKRTETVDTIRRTGEHLLAVINDILDLSKIEAEKLSVEQVDTPLDTILREVVSLFRPRALEKGISLTTKLRTPVPQSIISDPTRFRQILMNMVGNAIKFTERGGVCIEAHVEGPSKSTIVFAVQDTGIGLDDQQIKALFKPFSQADETVSRKFGGTGLGLTICRRLARFMGGEVKLHHTELGNGTCFRLELPLEVRPGVPTIDRLDVVVSARKEITVSDQKLSGRILLAEDGIDNQKLISHHLKKAGAIVHIADNGLIALHKIDEANAEGAPYDLLVTDMQMPEMDGYTLASTLRNRGSTIGIVAITAHAMAEDRTRCLDAGCDDYATKPIDKANLIAICQQWMGKTSKKAQNPETCLPVIFPMPLPSVAISNAL